VNDDKQDPASLALRVPPRPVTRLNRRTIAVVAGIGGGCVLAATFWSLGWQHRGERTAPVELHNTDRIAHAEGLAQLPDDYSKVPAAATQPPVLGPPLPGDVGNALALVQRPPPPEAWTPPPAPLRADPAADLARAERVARQREIEEAAKASVFFRTGTSHTDATAPASSVSDTASHAARGDAGEGASSAPSLPTSVDTQDRKATFLRGNSQDQASNAHGLQGPASPYALMSGTIIPAALITGIDSDLPGQVLATVTENVYDTATGHYLLIPQGSRLIGQYDSHVAFAQRRVLLVWTRLLLPDASSIELERLPGVDPTGYAGLEDQVDLHWRELLGGAALSTLIGIGAELAAPDRANGQSQVIIATRESLQNSVNEAGQQITRRSLDIQPTLTIRPGYPVRVIVNHDLVLRPYRPLFYINGK
jgi:type IV secretion system protein VirB10